MSVTLNLAGASAADAIVKGAPYNLIIATSTMDAATFDDTWLDQAAGIPGTNSVKASLTPAATVTTRGTAAGYTHATRQLNIGSTAGLVAGNFIWVAHGSITAGLVEIESIFSASVVVILAATNRFTADAVNVSFENAWTYPGTAGTAPSVSTAGGQSNTHKARLLDSLGNPGTLEESHFVKDLPINALLLALAGVAYNAGGSTNQIAPTISILNAFGTNNGGIGFVAMANHGVQAVNNATWGGGTTTEKTFAQAVSLGLIFTGGDGIKYGRLILKTKAASVNGINIDWSITLDSTGPTIVFAVSGR